MYIYNMLEYSSNDTIGSLCLYFKDEVTNSNNDLANIDNFKS